MRKVMLGLWLAMSATIVGGACSGNSPSTGGTTGGGTDGSTGAPAIDAGDVCMPGPDADAGGPACSPNWPIVHSNSGQVMNPLHLVTIVASNDPQAQQVFDFTDEMIQSQWWLTTGAEYGLGPITNQHITGGTLGATSTDAQLRAYITALVNSGAAPPADGQSVYMLFLPATVALPDPGACGYHTPFSSNPNAGLGDSYAIIGHCPGFLGETDFDSLGETASHELFEAATDPGLKSYTIGAELNQPWKYNIWKTYHSSGAIELGDLCEGTRVEDSFPDGGGYFYQRMWSNQAAALGLDPCLPHLNQPYYNASTGYGWYVGHPGGTVTVHATGWATDPNLVFEMQAFLLNGTTAFMNAGDGQYTVTADLGTTAPDAGVTDGGACQPRPAMSNGSHATITVPIPSTAVSGDYVVVQLIVTHRAADGCHNPLDDDPYHYNIFGVYVP
jgi:hypothetical protein